MGSHTDILVVGGGPAGLAAAIAARRKGFRVTVTECRKPPIDKACGEGLMPDGVAALGALGVEPGPGLGYPFAGIRFVERSIAAEAPFPKGFGLGIRRTALQEAMAAQAAMLGIDLRWETRVLSIGVEGAETTGGPIRANWIIGADGGQSRVRRWAGLDPATRQHLRYGFRRHYAIAPWTTYTELHWTTGCQIYITPVGAREVCVVAISRNPHLRLDDALQGFPEVKARLDRAPYTTVERGAVTPSRTLRSVFRGRVALTGDASGSVDAITGEGLCLAFQQAGALAGALEAGDLERYQEAHRKLGRRADWMARVMLAMDRRERLRHRTLHALAAKPGVFAHLLALHTGHSSAFDFAAGAFALGWEVLTI